jgi:preprotein translocase subunit SecG
MAMVMPLAVRVIAAVIGALLVITGARSVIGTVIVPRPVGSWLTRWVDRIVSGIYRMVTTRIDDHKVRDRILAGQAAAILLVQLVGWLVLFYVGFSLLLWPFEPRGIAEAFDTAGPAVFGPNPALGAAQKTIADLAAFFALITLTLQIAYLPTLYSEFNRRETEVTLLNARGGVPSWGPELLARTHYALGSGMSTLDTLPGLYEQWERWAADVAESHTTYLPLVRFRSPRPLSSWVTALLAVLDSAALFLALSPEAAPVVPARLCLRSGFICFREVARAMGIDVPDEPDPSAGISLSYDEFQDAIERMRKVDFPIERDPKDAWPDFVGWRVNYEQAAYAVAYALDIVPALWSGPRPRPVKPIPPIRPAQGKPPQAPQREHGAKSRSVRHPRSR